MNIKRYTCYLAATLLFSSCALDDKKDLGSITEVWNDAGYAEAYLNKLYLDNLPAWDNNVADKSDESDGGSGIMDGQLTTNSIDVWHYEEIRNINFFLEKIGTGDIPEDVKAEFIAQALVLRAWKYFDMIRVYGGVPLILHTQQLTDDLYVKRDKTSDCIAFLIADLDKSAQNLPWKWNGEDEGRITKAAALALKGRILLYNASPQFNPNNDVSRWETAYNANKEALDLLEENGYGLFESFEKIWFEEMNKEVIFVQRYQEPGRVHNWDAATRPLSEAQGAKGANQPTWEMVESFPMADGSSIKISETYDSALYWKNRDPRFYSTIAFNSCIWELSNKANRREWTYIGSTLNNPTSTGFYCRKAINTTYTPYFSTKSSTDWIEIRFAEVLLNYAECAAEMGKKSETIDALKQIRKRAGIKAGENGLYGLYANGSKNELVSAVINERKVELAFEGKRYWDLRRRRLFEKELNGTVRHGVWPKLIISEEEFNLMKDTIDFESNYASYFRDSIVVLDKKYDINFLDNYYFYAIPTKHLETNSNLQQTQGWDDGTFNPLD
jgi:hypothetical protein